MIALFGFMCVSIFATGMGFQDLRLANLDQTSLSWKESLPVWGMTVFVILAMVAALNAALGVGFAHDASGVEKKRIGLRIIATLFYFFFAFWSVGFGYGFFWKELAGQEYTQAQFKAAIEEVSRSESGAADALTTVESAVTSAASTARDRAEEEAQNGGTCANRPGSVAGDGPLTRARFAFADRAEALRDDVNGSWTSKLDEDGFVLQRRIETLSKGEAPAASTEIDAEEAALLQSLANPGDLDPDQRKRVFATVFDEARAFTAKANGLRATHAETFALRLEELATVVGPDPDNPSRANPARSDDSTYCWDTVLNEKLIAAAGSLRNLNDMPSPEFEFTEGPKATRAAFFNLARAVTSPVTGNGAPFGEKEFIALFASIAVDLGILFLTLVRAAMERKGFQRLPRDPKRFDLNDLGKLAARADDKVTVRMDMDEEIEATELQRVDEPSSSSGRKVTDAQYEEVDRPAFNPEGIAKAPKKPSLPKPKP